MELEKDVDMMRTVNTDHIATSKYHFELMQGQIVRQAQEIDELRNEIVRLENVNKTLHYQQKLGFDALTAKGMRGEVIIEIRKSEGRRRPQFNAQTNVAELLV